MKREEDEKLWDLLGQAAEPKISPFFARNVLRQIRPTVHQAGWRGWFGLRRLVPVAGMAVAIIAVALLRFQMPTPTRTNPEPDKFAAIEAQDSELMADLDDLVAPDDNNSLDDSVLL
ncbi:MAG: hypothetical protein DLM73_04425 [Chthoniobacterales bacterium]|nr:MAG: hypothetical protein DLM73_04425 [Chthoniobacterales bacterium]